MDAASTKRTSWRELDGCIAALFRCTSNLAALVIGDADVSGVVMQLHAALVLLDAELALQRPACDLHTEIGRRTSVLVARAAVVAVHLDALDALSLPSSMFHGALHSIADLRSILFDRIGRINVRWSSDLRRLRPDGAQLVRVASANADLAYSLVASDSDVEHFLREGLASEEAGIRWSCLALRTITSHASMRARRATTSKEHA